MLPSLAFLPRDVNDILASAGGLLFVEGGQQPRTHNNYDDPPYLCDWNFNYEAQSILCVCNPLTEEFTMLPPLTKNLQNKVLLHTTTNEAKVSLVPLVVISAMMEPRQCLHIK